MTNRTPVSISSIKLNSKNPRLIKDDKFLKLVESVKTFSSMLEIRPIVVDIDNVIIGGNMRYRACKEAGFKKVYVETFTQAMADEMNKKAIAEGRETRTYPEYCDEFIIKDNVAFGDWEEELLNNNWDNAQLKEWGLDVWQPEDIDLDEFFEEDTSEKEEVKNKIVLEYSEKDFEIINKRFNELDGSKESIVWNLLEL